MAKLTKIFYKNTKKRFKRNKAKQNIKLNQGQKSKYNSLLQYKNFFVTWQIQCRHSRGLAHAFWWY